MLFKVLKCYYWQRYGGKTMFYLTESSLFDGFKICYPFGMDLELYLSLFITWSIHLHRGNYQLYLVALPDVGSANLLPLPPSNSIKEITSSLT